MNDDGGRLPALARAADVLAVLLFLAAVAVVTTGGGVWMLGSVRLSVRTPWRLFLLLGLVVGVRHWLVPRPRMLDRLVATARGPLPLEERRLFEPGGAAPRRRVVRAAVLAAAGFSAMAVAFTWPQLAKLDLVPDLGDPLFSIWRIAWIAHQVPRNPLTLFDANIFHPERLTFTYSDPVLLPGLATAPFFWLGAHPLTIYNLLFLSSFALSGVTMFLLVRALTGRNDAAIVSGAIFTLYPYRFEHYSHLELQMTLWMPLSLWMLHRTMAGGRLRDGLLTGLMFALQMLSSLYYGTFLSAYLVVVGGALWLGHGRPSRPVVPLLAGIALAAALIAPVASRYVASRPMMGDRDVGTIEFYSAVGSDYLKAHDRSWTYHAWSDEGNPERQMFPRFTPVVLTAVALWPPLSVARIAYILALAFVVDGSFGMNGQIYPVLHEHVAPFRGLRVPARMGILTGLTLAILAGYGAARALHRWPRRSIALAGAMVAAVLVEAIPRIPLEPAWREPPGIYAHLPADRPAVLVEFPIPNEHNIAFFDTRYMYFSTFRTGEWPRLLNGNSGFFPASYMQLLATAKTFPSDAAVEYLKARGVEFVTIHGAFYGGQFDGVVQTLDARSDLALVAAAPWEGSESRLYRFIPSRR